MTPPQTSPNGCRTWYVAHAALSGACPKTSECSRVPRFRNAQLDVIQGAMAGETVPEVTLAPGRTVGLARTAAVFTSLPTHGPTLTGSSVARNVPAHLAAAFRTVSVLVPDASVVASLMLQAMGFSGSEVSHAGAHSPWACAASAGHDLGARV